MTHQPPVPEAAQSPYPLQPAAHNDGAKLAATPAPRVPAVSPALAQLVGIGAALIGSVGLAAWYFRRDKPGTNGRPAARKSSPARKSSSTSKTRASGTSSDRARVAAGQPYEVSYFARKHDISTAEARDIIKQAGPSRAKANELARTLKA